MTHANAPHRIAPDPYPALRAEFEALVSAYKQATSEYIAAWRGSDANVAHYKSIALTTAKDYLSMFASEHADSIRFVSDPNGATKGGNE